MTVALEGVSGQEHAPAALYPWERPGTHFTEGWVGPRASLDGRKSRPHRDSIPDHPARSTVAIPSVLPGPHIVYCQYISFRPRTQICMQEETDTQWTIMYSSQDNVWNNGRGTRKKGCIMWSCIIYTSCQVPGLWTNVGQWVRNVACIWLKVIFCRFLMGRREGKGPFRRPVWIWEDNTEMDFKELCEDGFWLFMFWESVERHSRELFNEP